MRHGRPEVVIVQVSLPRYRVPFFEALRRRLDSNGIGLRLVHGREAHDRASRGDEGEIAWAEVVPVRRLRIGRRELVWQHCLTNTRGADLVIVEQAAKNLVNFVLFARHLGGAVRLAMWGHGKNLRTHEAHAIAEGVKRLMTRRVHWWFAYTETSATWVQQAGVPRTRLTVVNNAIDTSTLVAQRSKITADDIVALRTELSIVGRHVCVYAGGLYAEKRLRFLVEAADLIRRREPEFELIVMGGGEDGEAMRRLARSRPWLHVVGPRFGDEKVRCFAASKLLLMPGVVGLAILDAFALETPIVTTAIPGHGPEIDYLVPGVNGEILAADADPQRYADAVLALLRDDVARGRLVDGCRATSGRYGIGDMADRFANGIVAALEAAGVRMA
jgi:L-malate glycosyltransferase